MRDQLPMAESEPEHIDDGEELVDRERLLEFVDQYITDHQELYDALEDE